jgi:hypothetical protein
MKRGVLPSTNLLGAHQPQDMKLAVSYLRCSSPVLLLRNPLGHLPQAVKQEQGRFHGIGTDEGCACVIRQTGGNRAVIPIGQADNEVRIPSSADPDELHALTVQRVVRMSHRYPFLRWFVKGGSVL